MVENIMPNLRKYSFSFLIVACLLSAIFTASAQNDPLPPLSPIFVDNIQNLTELGRIGRGRIYDIDLSMDGKTLAVTTSLGVWLYNPQDLHAIPELLTDADGSALRGIFSPGGQIATFYPSESAIRLWDISTKTVIATLNEVDGNPVFSPDGKWLAYSEKDHSIHLWDVEHQRSGLAVIGHEDDVTSIAFSPDSARLASSAYGSDGKLRIWNIASGIQITVVDQYANSLTFSPDGSLLAFWDTVKDRAVVWNVAEQKEQVILENLPGARMELAFSPDGSRLATANSFIYGSTDNAVTVWDVWTGQAVASLGKATLGFLSLAWAADGQYLFIAGEEDVQKWDVAQQAQTDITPGHYSAIRAMSLSPDESLIAAAYSYGKVRLFDAQTYAERATVGGHTIDDEVVKLVFSPDSTLLATLADPLGISRPNKLSLWDIATQTEVWTLESDISDLAFTPDGKALAVVVCETYDPNGCALSTIQFWDMTTQSQQQSLAVEQENIDHIVFNPDGKTLVSAGEHTAHLWDTASGKQLASQTYTEIIQDVGFDVEGQSVFVFMHDGPSDYPIEFWWWPSDGMEISALSLFQGHFGSRYRSSYRPYTLGLGGTVLLMGGADYFDGAIHLWSISSLTQIGQLDGHTLTVSGLSLNQAGDRLWSASYDGTIRLWGVPVTSQAVQE